MKTVPDTFKRTPSIKEERRGLYRILIPLCAAPFILVYPLSECYSLFGTEELKELLKLFIPLNIVTISIIVAFFSPIMKVIKSKATTEFNKRLAEYRTTAYIEGFIYSSIACFLLEVFFFGFDVADWLKLSIIGSNIVVFMLLVLWINLSIDPLWMRNYGRINKKNDIRISSVDFLELYEKTKKEYERYEGQFGSKYKETWKKIEEEAHDVKYAENRYCACRCIYFDMEKLYNEITRSLCPPEQTSNTTA